MGASGTGETVVGADVPPEGPERPRGGAGRIALALILTPVLLTLLWGVFSRLTLEKGPETEAPKLGIDLPAPDFRYPSLTGPAMSLSGQRGKLVLVNIWATWCPPCIKELPALQRLYEQMKREEKAPFEILAVSIDALGEEVVQKFVDRYGLTFPILLDPRGTIKRLYRTTGVPETMIVDPKGRLVQKVIGPREWDSAGSIAYFRRIINVRPASAGKEASVMSKK